MSCSVKLLLICDLTLSGKIYDAACYNALGKMDPTCAKHSDISIFLKGQKIYMEYKLKDL